MQRSPNIFDLNLSAISLTFECGEIGSKMTKKREKAKRHDLWVILVNMVISVILGHAKTKIQNIIDLEMIDVFSVKTIIHSNNKKMGHLI